MTMYWGAWQYSGGNGMRVGLDIYQSGVNTNSGNVVWDIYVYTENQYQYSDNQVLSYGGNIGGSTSYNNGQAGGSVQRAHLQSSYNYSTWGSSPGTYTFTASLSGAYNNVTPSVSVTVGIPARPYAAPNAPTSVSAVRNSDSQATVSWANQSNAQRPYTSLTVQMQTYSGSAWSGWTTVATVGGGATSYVQGGLSSNRIYNFRVASNNSIGSSGFAQNASYVAMTPAAPSSVASMLNSGGASITTTWTNNHYVEGNVTLQIQRSVQGGAYTTVVTGLAYNATSWTDSSPGAGTNTYQVRAFQSAGSLGSAYVAGNTVSTIVPPLAPTQLSPNGTRVDLTQDVVLTWKHNPGGDGAGQTQYSIQYSTDSGTTWVALPSATAVVSSASMHTIVGGTLANSATPYQWRVSTKAAAASFGPYSTAATFTGNLTPVVSLTAPAATTTSLPLVATWTYTQPEGSAQAAWQATLYEDTGAGGLVHLEDLSGTGATLTTTFTYAVVDGSNYVVQVQAQSAGGQWSNVASAATTISLPKPAEPVIIGEYQLCTGTVLLSISSLAPQSGEIAIDTISVDRRVAGGDWVQLVSNLSLPAGGLSFIDTIPLTKGTNEYRVTAASTAPSYRTSPTIEVDGIDGTFPYDRDGLWVFLAYGPAFSQVLRFKHDPSIKESAGVVRAAQPFLGRKKPVLLAGANTERTVGVSGSLYFDRAQIPDPGCRDDSPPNDWLDAAENAVVVAYRDYTGRRIFGMLSGVDTSDGVPGISSVSFTVTEVDYVETYG